MTFWLQKKKTMGGALTVTVILKQAFLITFLLQIGGPWENRTPACRMRRDCNTIMLTAQASQLYHQKSNATRLKDLNKPRFSEPRNEDEYRLIYQSHPSSLWHHHV